MDIQSNPEDLPFFKAYRHLETSSFEIKKSSLQKVGLFSALASCSSKSFSLCLNLLGLFI